MRADPFRAKASHSPDRTMHPAATSTAGLIMPKSLGMAVAMTTIIAMPMIARSTATGLLGRTRYLVMPSLDRCLTAFIMSGTRLPGATVEDRPPPRRLCSDGYPRTMTDTSGVTDSTAPSSAARHDAAAWARAADQWALVLAAVLWVFIVIDLVTGKFGVSLSWIFIALLMSFLAGATFTAVARLIGRFTLNTRAPRLALAGVLLPLAALPILWTPGLIADGIWLSPVTMLPLLASIGALTSFVRTPQRRAVPAS